MVSKCVIFITVTLCSLIVTAPCAKPSLGVEVEALKAFRSSVIDDPLGALADWNEASHHCNWSDIACDPSSGGIISISLVDKQLRGVISPFLGNLSSLQILDLTLNSFSGQIPAQLGQCSQLSVLTLYYNSPSGPIPSELGNLRNLQSIDFGDNSLNGTIPDSICNCTSLLSLGLDSNNLTGTIPKDIGNLANLQLLAAFRNDLVGSIPASIGQIPSELRRCMNLFQLELYKNQFTGSIPSELGNLVHLQMLRLYKNKLNSTIPLSLFQLKSLRHLRLSENELTGTVPQELGSLRSLEVLTLHFNKFTCEIPSSLTDLTNLTYLSLSFNSLTGILPQDIGKLYKLKNLSIDANLLEGSIPPSIINCTNLLSIALTNNRLTGKIPFGLGRLPNLTVLSIEQNQISGEIPDDLFNCSNLVSLRLRFNNITGLLKPAIGKLQNLRVLRVAFNSFVGSIPPEIGNLGQLIIVSLPGNSDNLLNGSIPEGMERLFRLMSLDLSHNHLTGPIPGSVIVGMKTISVYLNFSYNFLEGSIPHELGMLAMVQAIDISNNNLSGVIPETMEGCRNLFSLDLSGNKLSGPIPGEAFTHMGMLTSLNLSQNILGGQIPENLAKLEHLRSLDLSHNKLNGSIPESFANLSALRRLNLSFNQLEGRIPESGIFRNISSSSLEGNSAVCGTKFLMPCSSKKRFHLLSRKTISILLILGSVVVLVLFVLVIFVPKQFARKRKTKKVENPGPKIMLPVMLKRFDKRELENATCSFGEDNIIGASSLSTVYKGQPEDGQLIAVKKLNLKQFSKESDKCFYKEVKNLSHRNLVKVLGYAWESEKLKAVVLQYMENASLENIIHGSAAEFSRWTLSGRIDLCVSVGTALDYLHSGYDFPIVHCDLKPSNILLDGDWVAHVSDFGTARMLGAYLQDGSSLSSSSAFEGTIGYLAPEFAYMRKVTTKVDVFSFGTIMMEFLTGRRPTGLAEEKGLPISLRQLVEKALANRINGLLQVLDPKLVPHILTKEQGELLEELFKLALFCTCPDRELRPNMNEVLSSLLKLKVRN
ncbi:hypothetical protein SLA2020_241010 [Shorea laevis]